MSLSSPIDPMESILRLLDAPEELALLRPDDEVEDLVAQTLRETCQHLFLRLTELSNHHYRARGKPQKPISDLLSLVLMADESTATGNTPMFHGAETIWGQVAHIQSGPLRSLLRKSLSRLGTVGDDTSNLESRRRIRLLDEGAESEDMEDQLPIARAGSRLAPESTVADSTTDRIRARMSRAMNDMEEDDVPASDDDTSNASIRDVESDDGEAGDANDDDSLLDPAVRELNDGIFDFHEMEAFADEEEEYLPDSAFGVEKSDVTEEKRSLHARLRDGDPPSADERDDDDLEGLETLVRRSQTQRRRKYRDDEDIDALLKLYKAPSTDGGDGDDRILQMTALEMFGGPNPKYFKSNWNSKECDTSWVDGDAKDDESQDEGDGGSNDEYPRRKVDVRYPADVPASGAKGSSSLSLDRLALQAQALEQEMISEKPWQMRGEASSTSRPVNSLLVSRPEYEVAAKIAPTMTAESAEILEEVIKRRILNEEWDDVVPRELPDVGWSLRRGELPEVSQEKSKLSLGELYERDYLKKAMGYDAAASERTTELDKVKSEIRNLFANLSSSLDALSNYQFAPRPVSEATEVRVLATPAIAMEEVLPLHVSEARVSAPQEVHISKRGREGVLLGETEKDSADRKKARSATKAARRKARKEKRADEKLASRLLPNNPYERRKIGMELHAARASGKVSEGQKDSNGNFGDSATFFRRLQSEAEQATKGKQASDTNHKPLAAKVSKSLKL